MRRAIRSILAPIKGCFLKGQKANPKIEGKVVVRIVIEDQGLVRQVSTKTASFHDPTVEACVAARIHELRFPKPSAGTVAIVEYPFAFGLDK